MSFPFCTLGGMQMDIRIVNYDEYEDACKHKGINPHTEGDIIEGITCAGRIVYYLKIGEASVQFLWNHEIEECYQCKRTEEDVCEIRFLTFMV